jgi:predicted ATPase
VKLDRLWISEFKNLRDVAIDFDETDLFTVLVGWNGAGKSNVIEALVIIFRDLDLGLAPAFSYELTYRIRESTVTVRAQSKPGESAGTQYRISIRRGAPSSDKATDVSLNKFRREAGGDYLPRHVFAYYSGPSQRLEEHFAIHQKSFRDDLLYRKHDLSEPLRPLFYARPVHSQFVLLSFFLGDDSTGRDFIERYLGIVGLDSVLFVLRQPYWAKTTSRLTDDADKRFWGARGVVKDFMALLYGEALAPHRAKRRVDVGLGVTKTKEFLFLFLQDLSALHRMAANLSPTLFFKMLESTYLSDVIEEVRIRVRIRGLDGGLTFRELSEGEQQLLVVLGLLRFTGEAESLFLLDEPDTHLNPSWAVKYLSFLKEFVPAEKSSHVVIATHNPLAIAELSRSQVQIMWRSEENMRVYASPPAFDPKGLGFAGVLTSDMFGLETTLDSQTQRLLRLRRRLVEKPTPNQSDLRRLAKLNEEIDRRGFGYMTQDKDYAEYLQLRAEADSQRRLPEVSTPDDVAARRAKAKKIIDELLERKAESR